MAAKIGTVAVTLRPAVAADDDLLRRLYVDGRPELGRLPTQLLDLQIDAQRTQYHRDHPSAVDEIVEVDGDPVGRCWTSPVPDGLRVLDLAVLADRQRQGIGWSVLELVIERAAAFGGTVRLSVWPNNLRARRLYLAAGFTETGALGGYVAMCREPEQPS
jgi:ribosomal protein S18 acetylase RimI-like enzyme